MYSNSELIVSKFLKKILKKCLLGTDDAQEVIGTTSHTEMFMEIYDLRKDFLKIFLEDNISESLLLDV